MKSGHSWTNGLTTTTKNAGKNWTKSCSHNDGYLRRRGNIYKIQNADDVKNMHNMTGLITLSFLAFGLRLHYIVTTKFSRWRIMQVVWRTGYTAVAPYSTNTNTYVSASSNVKIISIGFRPWPEAQELKHLNENISVT